MLKRLAISAVALTCLFLYSCNGKKTKEHTTEPFQALSLLGDSLMVPDRTEAQENKLLENLRIAQADYDEEVNEMSTIWLGRRYAYLYDYNKAIDVFTDGIGRFPASYKLHRHRGHRHLSIRAFSKAVIDFEKAFSLMPKDVQETEPDGAPNKLNIPLSNTQFNVLYHLGLANYLKGNFLHAETIYKECMKYSGNPDLQVATADWLYMSLRRQGKTEEARTFLATIDLSMEIIENDSYLKRLRMYKGELAAEELLKESGDDAALSLATQGYGLGNWYLYEGDTTKALEIFERVVQGSSWSAFGYIAAEAELKILREK